MLLLSVYLTPFLFNCHHCTEENKNHNEEKVSLFQVETKSSSCLSSHTVYFLFFQLRDDFFRVIQALNQTLFLNLYYNNVYSFKSRKTESRAPPIF